MSIYPARVDLALGDSRIQSPGLEALGFNPTGVLPSSPTSPTWTCPRTIYRKGIRRHWTNVRFVGARHPEKRIEDVIRYFSMRTSVTQPEIRGLLLVGSLRRLRQVPGDAASAPHGWAVTNVHFAGHVPTPSCRRTTTSPTAFLCASAHEGFCVSIVESFYKQVPVMAYAATAVPTTMDGAGVLFTTQEPLEVAALMDAILDDPQLCEQIVQRQEEALGRLRARDFDGTLLRFIDQVLKSPRKPAPPVAWDFWDQVRLAEDLFELQQYRPAIFRGLPEGPESQAGVVEEKR